MKYRTDRCILRYALIITMIIMVTAISGCSSRKLEVTYYSDPIGASLYTPSGRSLGKAPITLEYRVTRDERRDGSKIIATPEARWISGAREASGRMLVEFSNSRRRQHFKYTFNRPTNVDGLETDMRYALDYQKLLLMQRQEDARKDQALADAIYKFGDAYNNAKTNRTNCVSTVLGDTVFTSCD